METARGLSDRGDHEAALEYVREYQGAVVEGGEADLRLRTNEASFLTELDRPGVAISILKGVLGHDRTFIPGWIAIGFAYIADRRYEAAAFSFQQVTELGNPDPKTFFTLVAFCQLQYDASAALGSADRALEHDPEWGEALKVKADALARLGHEDSAGRGDT